MLGSHSCISTASGCSSRIAEFDFAFTALGTFFAHPDHIVVGTDAVCDSWVRLAEIFGGHLLDAVSVTQSLVALSSPEAEFYACIRGTAGGLQTSHFLYKAGYKVIPRVWSDSSACRGIVRRTGSGRLRHLEIRHMCHKSGCRKESSC